MTTWDFGLLIGAVIGWSAATLWHHFIMWRTVKQLERQLGKSVEEMFNIDELTTKELAQSVAKDMIDLKAEYDQGMLLVYDYNTNQFLAQGRTITEVNNVLRERFGDKSNFNLKFDLDEATVKRIYKDINQ